MIFRRRKFTVKCTDPEKYDDCEPYEVTLEKGKYLFECVGASGATDIKPSIGFGARVSGVLTLKREKKFYLYIGGEGVSKRSDGKITPGGYNGGGKGGIGFKKGNSGEYYQSGYGGGGATDVRTTKGRWNDAASLDSRIIVAGAGGSITFYREGIKSGDGGTLEGSASQDMKGRIFLGGNQTSGYSKGVGEDGVSKTIYGNCGAEGNSGAGSGWYGGYASQLMGDNSSSGAGGGSSFISGHEGLEVIDNIKFELTHMEGGNVTKHVGDGYAIITRISFCSRSCKTHPHHFIFMALISLVNC